MTLKLFYTWLWIFIIYAFLGWCVEVIYHAITKGKFINRGFLNGSVCPVYGFGMLIVTVCLERLVENPIYVFLGGVVLTSALEFLAGVILERFFNDKWWDYSNQPLNIHGYICLRFSIVWGIAVLTTIYAIHPFVINGVKELPLQLGIIFLCFMYAILFTDVAVTIVDTLKLKQKIEFASNAEQQIRKMSNGIGGILAGGTINAKDKFEVGKEKAEESKERAKLRLTAGQRRLLKAYPRLELGKHKAEFAKLRMFSLSERFGIKIANSKLVRENNNIIYQNTFSTVINVLEARNAHTEGHSIRVSKITKRFCKVLELKPLEIETIVMCAKIHDIGMVGISDITQNKNGELMGEDWDNIKRHPDIGAVIILKTSKLDEVADIVRYHHENFDGSGYPRGLKKNEIPYGAQIISICNAVDWINYSQAHSRALTVEECLDEIKTNSGVMFNSTLVRVLVDNWEYILGDTYNINNVQ